ncbi:MAG: anti-sigma factor [Acidimicrobiia bacterium]
MIEHEQIVELVPLYALDALDGEELQQVETHLETCEICAEELAIHRSVTSTFVPDSPAPDHVWERIEAAIDQEPPSDVVYLRQPDSNRSKPLIWLASVAAVAAVVLGGAVIAQRATINELNGPQAVVNAAETAATEPRALVEDFISDGVPVAKVVLTPEGDGFVLPTEDLGSLGPDRTYQLWVITPDQQVISAGVLGNSPLPARFTWTGEVSGFALTREVAGGVEQSAGDVVSVIES